MLIELFDLIVTIRGIRGVELIRDRSWWRNDLCYMQLFLHPQQMRPVSDDPDELDVFHGRVSCFHALGKIQKPGS